ncbi:hypothetical protein ILUMI_20440 [Ignelater luminosus]|uniref:Histone acetyltransferase type B catalytic subunit n=1 Tax=Ignelater luminosus TaxID=2038154 RepID=A0A8K0G4K6_IGNLU|nr:hypothetical protein ILUMI_20440 [Ignelater luminosus]
MEVNINSVKPQLNGHIDIGRDDDSLENLYTCNAMEATNLKIVFTSDDLNKNCTKRLFKPELVHQIFGINEIIFGYRNIVVNIYVTANSAQYFIEVKYKAMIDSSKGLSPDNILERLALWLPAKYYTDRKQFIRVIERENHSQMFGSVVDTFETYNKSENATYKYIITNCSASEKGFAEFHLRFECMIVWFIDAASQIDVDDPNWIFLYVFEERTLPNGKTGYYPVGYCTIYKFFHFPDKIRTRISQLFVIPPCQRTGVGTKLLSATYKVITELPNVIDITVEDPCEAFKKMRDTLDCQLLMQIESFKYPAISKGFTQDMFTEANYHYKLNKQQCRRIYEILRMVYITQYPNSDEAQKFYNEIKQRVEAPYQREQRNWKKKGIISSLSPNKDCFIYQTCIAKKDECSKDVMSYIHDIKSFALNLHSKLY